MPIKVRQGGVWVDVAGEKGNKGVKGAKGIKGNKGNKGNKGIKGCLLYTSPSPRD